MKKQYEEDGFIFPLNVMTAENIKAVREDFELAETELVNDPIRLGLLRSYPAHLLPSFYKLIQNQNLITNVTKILGSDLMVWSSGMFIKEANSDKIVTWHQDLTYWV